MIQSYKFIFIKTLLISLFIIFVLSGCSTKFSTIKSEQGTVLYRLDEDKAFKLAYHSMLSVLPGRKITLINGSIKGYSTYFRFGIDTYSQQILIFPASGVDQNKKRVFGYYYEVSGSGSSFVQGRAKNVSLYETLDASLKSNHTGVIVTNLTKEKYKTKDPLKASKTSTTTKEDILNSLERLNELYKKGVLTEEEYKKEKAELLEEL